MLTKDQFKNKELFLEGTDVGENGVGNGGLFDGRTGIAIVYYLLAKESGNKIFADKGLRLMEAVSESGVSGENIGFAHGLAGIGWTIEWLAQNEFIEEVNTDDILSSVDSILYRAVSYHKDDNPSLANGTLGKIAYFAKRAVRHNPGSNRLKTVGHLECLVLLLDDLADKVNAEVSLTDLGHILTSITGLGVKVNSPTTANIVYGAVNAADSILSGAVLNPENYLDFLYLAVCYLIAARNKNHRYWEANAVRHIEQIASVANVREIRAIEKLFQKLVIYSLLNVYIPKSDYANELERSIAELAELDLPCTIVNGRGTLVVAELCLTNRGLISNWHEVFF